MPEDIVTEAGGVQAAIEHLRAALAALEMPQTPEEMPAAPVETAQAEADLFTESAAPLELVEAEAPANRRAPLDLDVGIIRVGPGNKRDNHYYTREMLERDGAIFAGSKMYATDHRNDEKSVRTEVSLIREVLGVKDFQDGAYLTGRVTVFNPDFAEDVRNRADAGVLDSLHCSILAKGEALAGEVDGAEYNVVQSITEAQSVDWVTRAGAGGHALQLTESAAAPEAPIEEVAETETVAEESEPVVTPVTISEDAEPETLTDETPEETPDEMPESAAEAVEEVIPSLTLGEIVAALGETNLPAASVAALASVPHQDLAELQTAVTAEVTRLKAAGSGQPLGAPQPPQVKPKSPLEIQAELQAVNQKYLRR